MTSRSAHTETYVERTREVCLDLDFPPLPRGWERCLDLKSGLMYFKDLETGMQFNTDPQTHKGSSKSFETGTTPKDPSITAKLDFKKSITFDSSSDHLLSRQLKHARSKTAQPDRGLAKPSQQSLKRQKVPSKDEDDGLGLHLSLSVKNNSYGGDSTLQSPQKSQAGDKPSKRQVELSLWSSIQSPGLERKCSKVRQSPTRASVAGAASSSVSRSSSSASSLSVGFEGNEAGDLREVESNKRKFSETSNVKKDSRPGEPTEMKAVGCARCLMFVLLYRNNPKCPKCGSSILLDLPVSEAKFSRRNIDK